ncbi:MAG TPA: FecR domain-containing protein, partial [Puia sp.]|nr:FecR domain-containing protein [Puia sp.]
MDELTNNDMENKDLPFGFQPKAVSDRLREENWKAVEAAIRQQENGRTRIGRGRVVRLVRVLSVAACLTAISFGVWWIGARTGHLQYSQIRTGYGEIKNIMLPDSSVVTLNANSTIRIPEDWSDVSGRQVWLEGEAYFQVQKKPATVAKFVVHTRQVDVEVLGTKFNVNVRREQAVVSLEEGKVKLSVHGKDSAVLEKRTAVILRPGQVVRIDAAEHATINDDKDVAARSGWTRHEFHFDNTRLKDIAGMIEDTYGYKMEAEDTSMLNIAVSGD